MVNTIGAEATWTGKFLGIRNCWHPSLRDWWTIKIEDHRRR